MIDVIHTAVGLAGTAILLKIVTDTFTRHKLINKGLIDEKVKYLFTQQQAAQPLSSMKWGMVLVAIGLALLLKQFWPGYVADETMFGLMFLFGGIGFLIYYTIADKKLRREARENPPQ